MSRNRRADPARKRSSDPRRHKHLRVWKNVGPRAVGDLEPGEIGELYLTEGESQALVEAGYLTPAEGSDADPVVEESGPPAEEKEEV